MDVILGEVDGTWVNLEAKDEDGTQEGSSLFFVVKPCERYLGVVC